MSSIMESNIGQEHGPVTPIHHARGNTMVTNSLGSDMFRYPVHHYGGYADSRSGSQTNEVSRLTHAGRTKVTLTAFNRMVTTPMSFMSLVLLAVSRTLLFTIFLANSVGVTSETQAQS